ncbi:MAG: hypothetical protein KAR07_04795 [Spirochaetes bacterium]|nr:hypothetical protein [Spirochaetota bacterium]
MLYKNLFKVFIVISFFLSLINAESLYSAVWATGAGDGFNGSEIKNISIVQDFDGTKAVRLKDNEYIKDSATDLLMNFNEDKGGRISSVYKNYSLFKQSYIINRYSPILGKSSIKFLRPRDMISLIPGVNSLLGESVDIGSFTIEFWLKPFSVFDNEIIFEKYGPFTIDSGETLFGGIRCLFKNHRVEWQFKNFFRDALGTYYNFSLKGFTATHLKTWAHVAISYDHFSGKLTKWVNGVEDDVIWATVTGKYGGSPLIPAFHKNLVTYPKIAHSYLGNMDELRISRTARKKYNLTKYVNKSGFILSKVKDLGSNHSRVKGIYANGRFPAGTTVFLEYRISDNYFRQNSDFLPWKRITNKADNIDGRAFGRYVQWRAVLHGVGSGRYSPHISSVNVDYITARNILRPVGLSAASGDGKIFLKWSGNTDKIKGYKIYFGYEKGEYLAPKSPIYVPLDRLKKSHPEYVIYGLENDRLYYIRISAYDRLGNGHESAFSREVFVRPSLYPNFR